MRQHFHRCSHLRVVSVQAEEVSGNRHRGSMVLDELCDARKLARCVGLAECEVLTPAEKRELLGTRVTRMREEEGGASAVGDLGGERGRAIAQLARDLLEEREEIAAENLRLLTEKAVAEDRLGRTVARSEEWELAGGAISMRWDEAVQRLQAARLDAIDRALEEMAGRSYGVCARCQGLIAIEWLRRTPDARVCEECAGAD